jgi:hypothetical protein
MAFSLGERRRGRKYRHGRRRRDTVRAVAHRLPSYRRRPHGAVQLLFARHHGGKFLLRIEDTDRARSTEPAITAILDGMRWLGLDWDGDEVYQFARASRHAEVATDARAGRCL